MNVEKTANFSALRDFYHDHLFRQVMPFWKNHCVDWQHGGLNNIVDDSGKVLSTDKVMWSQGRALWTFSALHRRLDAKGEWMDIAHIVAEFVLSICRKPGDAKWLFRFHQDGTVADDAQSVYVAGFIAYGLIEYARASGSEEALQIALDIYKETSPMLENHDALPTHPLPIPAGLQAHGPFMIFALVYFELGQLTGRQDILDRSLQLAEIIMTQHVKPDERLLYEYVKPGGQIDSSDAGYTIIPGHAIESMWFLIQIYEHFQLSDRIRLALDVIRWSIEYAWDEEFDGLFLAKHVKGGVPQWPKADSKVWWPATEAMVALLRAHEISGDVWFMDWYWKVHRYAFDNYPNQSYGEWRHNLDRFGQPTTPIFTALPVKDPFHLPRALIYSYQIADRLAKQAARQR